MSKIINFGITEDDINWREKDDYMVKIVVTLMDLIQ